ncbi:hypothetical protein [Paraburkholderia sediminicola]|uniref:hypothetical protein n=1 Tax=Paraburkholderia sediminicola TaxID=458836 RepID=UPI0038B70343
MNCKPGDLAITVHMNESANNGVIVEVESLSFMSSFGPVWNVVHRTPMFVDVGPGRGRWVTSGEIHDVNLMPISGVPVDDEVTEETTEEITA